MSARDSGQIWLRLGMTRRQFLRRFGIASGALTFSPFFLRGATRAFGQGPSVQVYKVMNGDSFQNTAKIWDMLGGPSSYIGPSDVVVIKANAQWPNQGYTHTGCIKGVIDKILEIPGFSGEIHICDDVQIYGSSGATGFDAYSWNRTHNWPDHNWNELAAEYQATGKPVATKSWLNALDGISGPADGEGWVRSVFSFHGLSTYLSYPIYESPLTPGKMIDMKNGVWQGGSYTGNVKAIFMPNLNNHGSGGEDYAGVTSAIKSFFGATEIHTGISGTYQGHYSMHTASFTQSRADYAGELTARYITQFYAPILYITAAMWSGHYSRTGNATETKTVLACTNPATLDYVACRDVISPYASYLNPDLQNNTRKQITGCISGGVGTITAGEFEILAYDFANPTVTRLDIDRKIKQHKEGTATEQEVKDLINQYMETP